MPCPWHQTPCQRWPLLPRKTAQRSVETFQRGRYYNRISVRANKTRTIGVFFALECLFGSFILHLALICFAFQPLKYNSSASLYPQEDRSPAVCATAQSGVNNKVSAWLQQTHDIDATSNGQNCLLFLIEISQRWLSGCMGSEDWKHKDVWVLYNVFDISVSELTRCQLELTELAQLIQRLHWLEGGLPITSTDLDMRISMHVSMEWGLFKCSF